MGADEEALKQIQHPRSNAFPPPAAWEIRDLRSPTFPLGGEQGCETNLPLAKAH